ncbi:MAG: single-stranded DNA-binding protein [Streptosporangiales bacterium]|nr:single-stranded DNA-binding protein [Streptosporangiales bacterium]
MGEGPDEAAAEAVNEIRLRGRLAGAPQARELPSGAEIVTWRVIVPRDPTDLPARPDGRRVTTVDTLDCSAWRAGIRRQVLRWRPGDIVEVEGPVHRRFYRSGGLPVSRHEIVARHAKRVAKAAD